MNRKLQRVLGLGVTITALGLFSVAIATSASATSTSTTPTPSSSPAPFTPIHKSCLWLLGPKSSPDPAHAFKDPQTLVGCVDGTDGTSLTLPTPPCGVTYNGQGDHYTINSAADLVKFNALIKSGKLNSPADDGPFYASNSWWPTKTGAKCETSTPTPTPTPTTSSPTPTPTPTPTPVYDTLISAKGVCAVGLSPLQIDNTNSNVSVHVLVTDAPSSVPLSPYAADYTVAAGATDSRNVPFLPANVAADTLDSFAVSVTGSDGAFFADIARTCPVTTGTPTSSAPASSNTPTTPGTTPAVTTSSQVVVPVADVSTSPPLAFTGAPTGKLFALGAILLLGGTGLLFSARRRGTNRGKYAR